MGFQRAFGITTIIGSVLLSLAACGAVGVQSESQTVILGTAAATSTATATATVDSTSTKPSGILDRSGSQQQRDCLHCAP
jgi:hypothetical protein